MEPETPQEKAVKHGEQIRTLFEWRKEVNTKLEKIYNILIFETLLMFISLMGFFVAIIVLTAR